MIASHGHSRLHNRYELRAALVCETALHVGSGGAGDVLAATDMPVACDGAGRPYVPGSSFRGALRAGLESLLRGLGRPPDELRVCDPLEQSQVGERASHDAACSQRIRAWREDLAKDPGEPARLTEERAFELAWRESCAVCRLFGNTFLASRVRIGDLRLLSDAGEAAIYLRDGVGLDRDLRSAARGVLYSFEAVCAGARFELRIDVENAADHELGLLLTGLGLFEDGLLCVGGKRARGLGRVRIETPAVARWTAADFFADRGGHAVTDDELGNLRQQAYQHYVEGSH